MLSKMYGSHLVASARSSPEDEDEITTAHYTQQPIPDGFIGSVSAVNYDALGDVRSHIYSGYPT